MREYDLEEILAEYAEENPETAQPEEEAVPPEENAAAAEYPYEEETTAGENALPSYSKGNPDIPQSTYDALRQKMEARHMYDE